MILDALTSSPIIVSIFIGLGLVYLYYRKPGSAPASRPSQNNYGHSSITADRVIDQEIQRAIAQIERQEREMLRQEQDEAYLSSLKADREKQLKREKESKQKEEQDRIQRERVAREQEYHNKLVKLKDEIASSLPSEPSADEQTPDQLVKLVFKLPDGTRIKRNFRRQDKVKYIYWYIFSLKNAPLQFKLTTNFPKRDLPGRPPLPEDFEPNATESPNCEETLTEVSLTETQTIFVHDLEA